MYHSQLTIQPWEKSPPEEWIKNNLFEYVIEESDLMNKLIEGNKIVVELNYTNVSNSNTKYEMDMNLTYTLDRNITYDNYEMQNMDKDYMQYLNFKNKSFFGKVKILFKKYK